MKFKLEDCEPTERTFAACETPQDLRNRFHSLVLDYDFLVHVRAISRSQRAVLIGKLLDFYELRLKSFVEEELKGVDPV